MDLFKKYNIKDMILSIGYKADMIKRSIGSYYQGLNINYVVEEEPLGTAGCLNLLKNQLTETFAMINGDNLQNINITDMIDFHKRCGGLATIALLEVEDTSKYGVAKLEDNKILEFVEKPKKEEAPSNFINSGFYILEPQIIDLIKDKKFAMIEKDIFPRLAKQGKLFGYKFNGQWFDTGTFENYEKVIMNWKDIK
jgi:NDP-sugar pyrophosphorylase family protein